MLQLYSEIAVCRAPLARRLLWPLLWLRRYLDDVKTDLFVNPWSEPIQDEPKPSWLLHGTAFLVLSAAAFLAHRYGVTAAVAVALLGLWPLNLVEDRLGMRTRSDGRVELELRTRRLRWRHIPPTGGEPREARIPRDLLQRVAIRSFDCPGARAAPADRGFQVSIETREGASYPVHFESVLAIAWRRALPLSVALRRPLELVGSLGTGSAAQARTRPVLDPGDDRFWRREALGGGARLIRDRRSIRPGLLALAGLQDAGLLLFLILIGALLGPYGSLLDGLAGSMGLLGAGVPAQDETRGMLGIHVHVALAAGAGAFALGIWRQSQPQEIRVEADKVRWWALGRAMGSMPTGDIEHLLLLYEPAPMLMLAGRHGCLTIDRIASRVEQDELYAKMLDALGFHGILTPEHLERLRCEAPVAMRAPGPDSPERDASDADPAGADRARKRSPA